jgi:glycosyltransferase involved in cell wall biosynthesis
VRLVNQQLNDFTYCQPGFADHVDVFTSPSAHHIRFIGPQAPGTYKPDDLENDKWCVLPNGCDPTLYTDGLRVPGRVLWASSPDRGLHLLLQAWPEIRRRVPHATLHALYNFAPGPLLDYEEGSIGLNGLPVTPDIQELAQRYRYIRYATTRLKDMGVVQVGSCSRSEVVREMNEAVVLGYPCDTIRYTEGFSVTTMEACAAGLVPVISDEDALGSIYEGCAAIIPSPVANKLDLFVSTVVGALGDKEREWQDFVRVNCRDLAARHAWPVLAERLEQILMSEYEKKHDIVRISAKDDEETPCIQEG